MNLSIIIPAFNEEESIKPLVNLIFKNLDKNLEDFEIILIDDGSNDKTWDEIVKISNKFENIVSIKLLENGDRWESILAANINADSSHR